MIQVLDTRYGRMYVPDTDNAQYAWLLRTGASPEDEHIELVCDLLDERLPGVAVDVGANFGCWTLPLAAHATSVIAFEPQRCVFECLSRSIEGLLSIVAHNAAVGSGLGTIRVPDLNIDQSSNFGGVTLAIPHHEQPDRPMLDVPLVTLDAVLCGRAVSFIKIDVEGGEADVIEGARDTIKRCRPILFVEMDHKLTDAAALRETIEAMGYATEKRGGNFLGMPL